MYCLRRAGESGSEDPKVVFVFSQRGVQSRHERLRVGGSECRGEVSLIRFICLSTLSSAPGYSESRHAIGRARSRERAPNERSDRPRSAQPVSGTPAPTRIHI